MGIRQLAESLGLSIGTVSRALNDRPDVNADTRARVKAAAVALGYVPNQSGRSLRSGRTGIVAAVIPTLGGPPTFDSGLFLVLEGARRELRRQALDLIVLFRGPEESPLENLQRIVQRRIADSVIISQTTPQDPRIDYLKASGLDFVTFGRSTGLEDYPFVDFDFEGMAAESVRRFVADGHRHIGLALRAAPLNYESLILEAMRAEAARCGLTAAAIRAVPLEKRRLTTAGTAAITGSPRPTALLATHECIATSLYGELADRDIAVGADVSVVCCFPAIEARGLTPALSYFDADLDAVGVALARRLAMRQPDARPDRSPATSGLVPLRFVARASHLRAPRAA